MQVRRKVKRERKGKYTPRPRVCSFCVEHVSVIDYKDVARLRHFISDRARIEARRRSGACAKHQRALGTAIKRARHLALLPFVAEHARVSGAGAAARAVPPPSPSPAPDAPAAPQPSESPESKLEAETQTADSQ